MYGPFETHLKPKESHRIAHAEAMTLQEMRTSSTRGISYSSVLTSQESIVFVLSAVIICIFSVGKPELIVMVEKLWIGRAVMLDMHKTVRA